MTFGGKLFTPLCPFQLSSNSGTSQWAVTLCGWEGNRRSGITMTPPSLRLLHVAVYALKV